MVTDLTGTKWSWNFDYADFTGAAGYPGGTTKNINFISNSQNFSGLTFYQYHSGDGNDLSYVGNDNPTVWESDIDGGSISYEAQYQVIEIIDGTDVTDSTLISWLEANAQQIIQSTTDFDLSTLGLASGNHIITVIAKASGYRNSQASNAVTYSVYEASQNNSELTIEGAPATQNGSEVTIG